MPFKNPRIISNKFSKLPNIDCLYTIKFRYDYYNCNIPSPKYN